MDNNTNSYRVTCSCGKQAIIVWAPALGKYVSVKPDYATWRFCDPGSGWTCGEVGHEQSVNIEQLSGARNA